MMNYQHPVFSDERGKLMVIEAFNHVPFMIKRMFLIFDVPAGETRGGHAHKVTQQYLISITGSCTVTLDDGQNIESFELNSKSNGLLQTSMTWGSMTNFSKDANLLVLASEFYQEEDYIQDYDKFLSMGAR